MKTTKIILSILCLISFAGAGILAAYVYGWALPVVFLLFGMASLFSSISDSLDTDLDLSMDIEILRGHREENQAKDS